MAQSETDKEKKHNLEVRQTLAAMSGDFQKSKQKLDEATTSLVKIGEEIGGEKANRIWSIVERILFGAILCQTTSEMLKVAAYVDTKSLSDFFGDLKPHLLQGRVQLEMQYNGLKGYSAFVKSKTALWEIDKAKEAMEKSLESYKKALALLQSPKKSADTQ
jgi:hypothetical protein